MKKAPILLSLGALFAATPVFAEDSEWTGPYAGVSASYIAAKSRSDITLDGSWTSEGTTLRNRVVADWSAKQSSDVASYGGQIGYNYEVSKGIVLGIEGDFSGVTGDGKRSFVSAGTPSYTFGNQIDPKTLYTLRGRVGYAVGGTLIYGHGGWAGSKVRMAADVLSNGGYSKRGLLEKTIDGYVVGGGIEQKLGKRLSAKLEYSYADLGDENYTTAYQTGSSFAPPTYNYGETIRQDFRMHMVRVGLNFAF